MNRIMISLSCLVFGATVCNAANLFQPTNNKNLVSVDESDFQEQFVIRRQYVNLDASILPRPSMNDNGDMVADGSVTLNLFDDLSVNAVIDRVDPGIPGVQDSHVLVGHIDGREGTWVFLSRCGNVLRGDIFAPDLGTFQIRYANNDLYEVREVFDEADFPCGNTEEHRIILPQDSHDASQMRSERVDGQPVIDILIVYTPAVLNQAGSHNAIGANVANWIAITNNAYSTSLVNQRIRLVGLAQTNYNQSSNGNTDLSRLQKTNDGYMDEVHALRDETHADIVHLIVSGATGLCGIGYLMTDFYVSYGFAAWAFSLTVYSCDALAFAHELGHNMGCDHDHQNPTNPSGAFCHSYGYRTPGNQYRTIMAYAPGTRLPMFSNPNVNYSVFPMGISGNECPLNAADNASSLNLTAPIVANFRNAEPNPADINGDGIVNATDLAYVLSLWGQLGGVADVNGDGIVNAADIAGILGAWTV